jgi:lipopolysaccharide transport system ATP-binding protein
VGDALFQKRCFQQLEKLTANGTSVLFVSHDQEAMRTLTHRAILMSGGEVITTGTSAEVLLEYRRLLHDEESAYFKRMAAEASLQAHEKPEPIVANAGIMQSDRFSFGDRDAEVLSVKVLNDRNEEASVFHPLDKVRVRMECILHKPLNHLNIAMRIRNKEGVKVYSWGTLNQDIAINSGLAQGEVFWENSFDAGRRITIDFTFECQLGTNLYEIQGAISQENKPYYAEQRMLHWIDEAAFFHVIVKEREYFFGGAFDLRMKAAWVRGD